MMKKTKKVVVEWKYVNIIINTHRKVSKIVMKQVRMTQIANKYRVQLRRTMLGHQMNIRFVIITKEEEQNNIDDFLSSSKTSSMLKATRTSDKIQPLVSVSVLSHKIK